ncbi:MAG: PQQ-binding-like beta-propeller repeat protein [Bdellovibrionales bacterium]|jgi:outer membrane protein assembly factor BamB|nr:PQQ-binding-like beta-propeller repeat protein [Bdellovibrionales bacterium]
MQVTCLTSEFSAKYVIKRGFVFIFIATSLWGCASFKSLTEGSLLNSDNENARKEFVVKKVWVRPAIASPNEGVRKLNRMSPIIAGDVVIQGNGIDGVAAYSSETGRLIWKRPLSQGVEASGVLFKDRVYLAASDGTVLALNKKTGESLWTASTKSENTAQPSYDPDSGTLFVLSGSNGVHSFDGMTGKTNWIYTRQDTSSLSIRGGSLPVLSKNGLLYVGFSEGSFVALNAKSGTVAWEINLNKNKRFRDVEAGAVLDNDRIYVSGFDDKLYALSLTGEIIWRLEEGGYSPVRIDGEKMFYSTTTGKVLCLNKGNGKVQWSYLVKDGLASEVRLYKGLAVFGESQGNLVFLNSQTGAQVGSFEPGRGVMAAPSFSEDGSRMYIISGEANLYALEAKWQTKSHFEYLR